MFKFKQLQIVVAVVVLMSGAHAKPGDIQGAAETVDVPPEHRAAPPPQAAQPRPQFPGYRPGAVYPGAAGGVNPLFPTLFFQTQNAYVPYASTFNAYRVDHAAAPAAVVQQPQDVPAPTLVLI
ncbi:uncharacterized protein LOC101891265 [Musca domestica]|uniref:Uncharacterized protein LOC101891265 isoform X1 n=1 Tax=Musca domestica TaxID=7370 RepID=A0A1I8MYZ9_MUSDO|nr:uncharacterized protein LOC101891265 [Musca domestica]